MKKSSAVSEFVGFPKELFGFLKDLRNNNDREWFAENKKRYEQQLLEPCLAFITAMQPRLKKLSSFMIASPKKVGGSLMRIYRDTRFSNNKVPYKTNVGIQFRHELGSDVHAPGLYLHLEPGECFVGAGIWMPPTEAIQPIRQMISDESKLWKKVRDNKRFQSRYKLAGDSLKTVPRGYDADHPMIEDLRRKSFIGVAKMTESQICSPKLVDNVSEAFLDAKPLMKFLCDALNMPF